MTRLANVGGTISSMEDARVPVVDRGFLYGDSVYEVVRTYDGRPFAVGEHLDRLERSAARLFIDLPARSWIEEQITATIRAAANEESYCRIIVTRGSGPISLDPTLAEGSLTVILVKEYEPFPDWMYEKGIKVHIPLIRRNPPAALDPAIKSGNYLNSVLALGEARKAGFDDALMLGMAGRVTEATSANVFAWRRGQLCTPTLGAGILEGVTRRFLIRIASDEGIPCEECDLYPDDLVSSDEVMLTSTLKEALPIVQVGEKQVGKGVPGPMAARLRRSLREFALRKVHAGKAAP